MSSLVQLISKTYNSPEVQKEIAKAGEELRDPLKAVGERIIESVKNVLNPPQEQEQEFTGYVKN